MIDNIIDEKHALELNKIYNHFPDKGKFIIKSTQFKVEDIFGDIRNKDSISTEQITKLNKFSTKLM